MHFKIHYFKLLFLVVLILFMGIPLAGAQSSGSGNSLIIAQNQPVGGVDFKEANREAIEKLRRMTPEEIDALDKKLADALILYYDRKFARALAIFKEIADQVETTDLMFWIGTSAMEVGETQLAVEKFKRMLAIDPQLHRARLELAATYFKTGRYAEARQELEIVQAASPPPGVQKNITKLLAAIEERTKKLFYNLRASLGFMYDDNISSGPEQKSYAVAGGSFTPSATAAKLQDEALVARISGNALYDIGASRQMMWNTAMSLYNKTYSSYSQFNYLALDVTTGPWWTGTREILKIPLGYFHSDFESERLSEAFHLDPSYEYHFNPRFSLKGLYSYTNENFFADSRGGLDNVSHLFELTPSMYLKNRKHTISATVGYENHNAEDGQYSYADPYLTFSYFLRCTPQTEVFLRYQYFRREFEEMPTLYRVLRTDKRHMYTAVISQGFRQHFFASFEFGYIDNSSNLGLYDYDKTTYTVSIGYKF